MGRYTSGLLAGSAVIALGYGLMKYTVPTPEQFIQVSFLFNARAMALF